MIDIAIDYILRVLPLVLLVGGLYVFLRYQKLKRAGERPIISRELPRGLFVCYLAGLISLVWLPMGTRYGSVFAGEFNVNLTPALFLVLRGELTLGRWTSFMLLANVLMLVPMGFFLPWISGRVNGKNIFPVAIAVPLAIELPQLLFGRSFDVDDILCNALGILIGFCIFHLARAVFPSVFKQKKA